MRVKKVDMNINKRNSHINVEVHSNAFPQNKLVWIRSKFDNKRSNFLNPYFYRKVNGETSNSNDT